MAREHVAQPGLLLAWGHRGINVNIRGIYVYVQLLFRQFRENAVHWGYRRIEKRIENHNADRSHLSKSSHKTHLAILRPFLV